ETRQILRQRDLLLEALVERLLSYRLGDVLLVEADPDAAAFSLGVRIGNQYAVGRDDEADELGNRPHLAGQRALPLELFGPGHRASGHPLMRALLQPERRPAPAGPPR